jgi:hypothetical protein
MHATAGSSRRKPVEPGQRPYHAGRIGRDKLVVDGGFAIG